MSRLDLAIDLLNHAKTLKVQSEAGSLVTGLLSTKRAGQVVDFAIHLLNSAANLKVQLEAVSALAKSESPEALLFLQRLYESTTHIGRCSTDTNQGGDTIHDEWDVEYHNYPYARGPLRQALEYEVQLSCSSWAQEWSLSEADINAARVSKPTTSHVHQAIQNAIRTLSSA